MHTVSSNWALSKWDELIGVCEGYHVSTSSIHLSVDGRTIVLPLDAFLSTLLKDQKVIGKRVGVLKTDLHLRPFLVRIVEE